MIVQEDVWEPAQIQIIGNVVREQDPLQPMKRFDPDGKEVEVYECAKVDHISGFDRNIHKADGMVSKVNDAVCDYYLFRKDPSEPLSESLILNKNMSAVSCDVIWRYSSSGEFVGLYYCGWFKPFLTNLFKGEKFLETVRNYYYDKGISKPMLEKSLCIQKDFGNRAVYILY